MNQHNPSLRVPAVCLALFALPFAIFASTSFTINNSTADAFLSGANPGLNFGAAGTLAIAPASSAKGEFDSVLMFNTASATSQFNATYGTGNWQLTGLTLSFASNFGTNGAKPSSTLLNTVSGGNFAVDWLANTSWVEGSGTGNGSAGYPANSSVSFNSISGLLASGYDSLGTYTYTPPGNNVYANYSLPLDANLVTSAAAGGNLSLYFYAADNQVSYVFNSHDYTGTPNNHPELTLIAEAVPEPTTAALLAISLGGLLSSRRFRRSLS
jgi:hypothetical protein